jgi:cytoskeletal protein RodZ
MRRQTVSNILFWTVAAVGAALLVGFVLALAGVVPVDPAPDDAATTEQEALFAPPTTPAPTRPATTRATTRPKPSPPPTRTTAPATTAPRTTTQPTRPEPTSVVITASRGESWFSARLGSENGRVLDERVLAQGESARFEGARIWLSVGAAGNVDITVDGKRRAISPGTVSLVLTGSPAASSSS